MFVLNTVDKPWNDSCFAMRNFVARQTTSTSTRVQQTHIIIHPPMRPKTVNAASGIICAPFRTHPKRRRRKCSAMRELFANVHQMRLKTGDNITDPNPHPPIHPTTRLFRRRMSCARLRVNAMSCQATKSRRTAMGQARPSAGKSTTTIAIVQLLRHAD